MKKCYIFAAGDFDGKIVPKDGDYIIAADAGYCHLEKLGIKPDLLIGDFDSIENIPEDIPRETFPSKKDFTDTHLAIRKALSIGCEEITVCGAFGGDRLDHTVANLQTAVHFAESSAFITFTDGKNTAFAIKNKSIIFDDCHEGYVSVLCFSGIAEKVSIKGLKYELDNETLLSSNPLGVSNEFIGKEALISVENGTLIIIYQNRNSEV